MAKQIVSVRLEPEMIEKLDWLAEREKMNRSEIVEHLLGRAIPSEESFLANLDTPVLGNVMRAMANPKIAETLAKTLIPMLGLEADMKRFEVARESGKRRSRKGESPVTP